MRATHASQSLGSIHLGQNVPRKAGRRARRAPQRPSVVTRSQARFAQPRIAPILWSTQAAACTAARLRHAAANLGCCLQAGESSQKPLSGAMAAAAALLLLTSSVEAPARAAATVRDLLNSKSSWHPAMQHAQKARVRRALSVAAASQAARRAAHRALTARSAGGAAE